MHGNMKLFVCGMLTAAAVTCVFTGCSNNDNTDGSGPVATATTAESAEEEPDLFQNDIAGKVGEHIYYSTYMFEYEDMTVSEKKELIEYLEEADKDLDEDIFVIGYKYIEFEKKLRVYARQYKDGVVVPEITYGTDLDKPGPNIVINWKSQPVESIPDKEGLIDPEDLFETVVKLAEEHKNELSGYREDGVYGTYLLCYDLTRDILVYEFRINDYSALSFDAKTGELVHEYYYDGVIVD